MWTIFIGCCLWTKPTCDCKITIDFCVHQSGWVFTFLNCSFFQYSHLNVNISFLLHISYFCKYQNICERADSHSISQCPPLFLTSLSLLIYVPLLCSLFSASMWWETQGFPSCDVNFSWWMSHPTMYHTHTLWSKTQCKQWKLMCKTCPYFHAWFWAKPEHLVQEQILEMQLFHIVIWPFCDGGSCQHDPLWTFLQVNKCKYDCTLRCRFFQKSQCV